MIKELIQILGRDPSFFDHGLEGELGQGIVESPPEVDSNDQRSDNPECFHNTIYW
jgi:hypothetical protein